jgi:hypothetical protein
MAGSKGEEAETPDSGRTCGAMHLKICLRQEGPLLTGCFLLEIDYPGDANESQSLHIDGK